MAVGSLTASCWVDDSGYGDVKDGELARGSCFGSPVFAVSPHLAS